MPSPQLSSPRSPGHKRRKYRPHRHHITDCSNGWNHPVDQSGWDIEDTSYLDPKATERQDRVGGLKGLVLFWMRGVDAAEKGEAVSKMADFYGEEPQENPWVWGSSGDSHKINNQLEGWGASAEDWDASTDPGIWNEAKVHKEWGDFVHDDDVGALDTNVDRHDVLGGRQGEDESVSDTEVRELVSRYAHGMRPERRRDMYEFVAMRTEDKVQKIQDMVYHLQSNGP